MKLPPGKAFTLIELVAAVAITAILVGLAIPLTGRLRASADATGCMNNLRRIGEIIHLAAADADGRIPRLRNRIELDGLPREARHAPTLRELVQSYGGTPGLLICPAERRRPRTPAPSYEWLPLFENSLIGAPSFTLPGYGAISVPASEAVLVAEFQRNGAWPHTVAGTPGGNALMAEGNVKICAHVGESDRR